MTIAPPKPATSIAAAKSVDMTHLEQVVLEVIKGFGVAGCISDEVQALLPELSYSSVTARFKSLEERGEIVRDGDTRPGLSGRQQQVMRTAEHASTAPKVFMKKGKRAAFLAGMMFAAKVVLKAGDYPAAKAALLDEIKKAAKR